MIYIFSPPPKTIKYLLKEWQIGYHRQGFYTLLILSQKYFIFILFLNTEYCYLKISKKCHRSTTLSKQLISLKMPQVHRDVGNCISLYCIYFCYRDMFIIREGQETPGFWNAFDWKEKSDIDNNEKQPENWVRVYNTKS